MEYEFIDIPEEKESESEESEESKESEELKESEEFDNAYIEKKVNEINYVV